MKGYTQRRDIEDEQQWIMGMYIIDAVGTVVSNAFKGHHHYMSAPIIKTQRERRKAEVTEEYKERIRTALFARLEAMMHNFNQKKKEEKEREELEKTLPPI